MIEDPKLAAALLKRKEWRIRQRERGLAINVMVPEKAAVVTGGLSKLPATDFSKSAPTGAAYFARDRRRMFGDPRWPYIDDALSDD